MSDIKKREIIDINLFVASGAETEKYRNKLQIAMSEFNEIHKKGGFHFQLLRWEYESAAIPGSKHSQDEYDSLIDESQMLIVIIKNTLGKYTMHEFEHALKLLRKNRKFPKIIVYTLPSNADNIDRSNFIASLRSDTSDYFHVRVDNVDQLIHKVTNELLRIRNEYEAEQKAAIAGVDETIERLPLTSKLVERTVELFNEGEYAKANASLSVEEIRKQAKT
ncbi:hypothetical protein OfM1_20030 [Lactovum odontotermitis]